jgi:CO/xanthine dehydrogenase FAD-binding subunit
VYYDQSEEWRTAMGACLRDRGDVCLVTGSKPNCYSRNVSDLAPALIALDAAVIIRSRQTSDTIPMIDLYNADGLHPHRHRDDDSIIVGVSISCNSVKSWFRKLRLRRSMDFTSLTVAATVDETDYARVCLNGVSMAPVLLQGRVSDLTLDALQRRARKACQTVENDLMPLKYRREMIGVYLEEWWESIH